MKKMKIFNYRFSKKTKTFWNNRSSQIQTSSDVIAPIKIVNYVKDQAISLLGNLIEYNTKWNKLLTHWFQ